MPFVESTPFFILGWYRMKGTRIKTLREGESGAPSECNNWRICLINERFSAQDLVLEAETSGLTTTDGSGSTQTLHKLSTLCFTCAGRAVTFILVSEGSRASTNQIGSSFSGGEQDLGFFAIPHWCWLSHGCRPRSRFHNHLQRNKNE